MCLNSHMNMKHANSDLVNHSQARIDNAHSEEPMEPAIIRWEWFRIPGNALFGMAIAVEFRNRIGEYFLL